MYKIGNDVTTISRFNNKIENEYFIKKILSKIEQKEYKKLNTDKKALYLAKRWCSKEAYLKLYGFGIDKIELFQNLTLINVKGQKPYFLNENIDVSIAHENDILFISCVKNIKE